MHLIVKMASGEVLKFNVQAKVVTIGRAPQCEVVIPHEGISRQHCQIEVVDRHYFVTDLGSKNGIFRNDYKLTPKIKTPYLAGHVLSFGTVLTLVIDMRADDKALIESVKFPALELIELEALTKTIQMGHPQTKAAAHTRVKNKNVLAKKPRVKTPVKFLVALIMSIAIFWFMKRL